MRLNVLESSMKSDVLYAMTDDGTSLPVIDVTHPSFAVSVSETELAEMTDRYLVEIAKWKQIPAPVREAIQQSVLGGALSGSNGSFLSGMHTYMMKLGPLYWGADAHPIYRSIAASLPAFAARIRLQDMARLLADGVLRTAAANPGRPICLINIGGGPASDSWNALLHLHAAHPNPQLPSKIKIAVLDIDHHGPAFGSRAIEALCAPNAPLAGLDIGFRHFAYQWSAISRLREILDVLQASEAVCAVSSEGGLFEYGSDTEIVSNLRALRAQSSSDAIVVGSVTRDGEATRATQTSGIRTLPRTIEAFRSLAEEAGWRVQEAIERPFSYNLRMGKA
jgi:hypothetical protein